MSQVDVSQPLYAVESILAGRAASQELPPPRVLARDEWPPDYARVLAWRRSQLLKFERDPGLLKSAREWYAGRDLQRAGSTDAGAWAERCIAFTCHWLSTHDPRNAGKPGKNVQMPFVLFERQADLMRFVVACMVGDASGLVEKARTMGATWTCISVTTWLWLFQPGIAVGWGANKLELVDVLGDPDTIMEKLRNQIRLLPDCFRPPVEEGVHLKHTVCRNPDNEAVVSGQGGKNIGRGGRRRIYFIDEAAHIDKPVAIEASLSENTRCRIDISSVSSPGTVYHRKRLAGREWARGGLISVDAVNVFIMDWADHPEKTPEWYADRRRFYEAQGTPEVVAREIDRDYMGATQGIIIKYEWVQAAVDAHLVIPGLDDSGGWWGGLDVADEGVDTNALVRGRGATVKYAEEWGERDPGATARRAFRLCRETRPIDLQYDCIGMGTAVKSEFNRIAKDDGVDLSWLRAVPWSASAAVLEPGKPVIAGDPQSPTNKNYFENFKAQAWWSVSRMFYRTWRAVRAARGELGPDEEEGTAYPPDQLISLDSKTIPQATLAKLMRELAQATMGQSSRLKLIVDKSPDGAKSPNLADGLVMGKFPARMPVGHLPSLGGALGPKMFVG